MGIDEDEEVDATLTLSETAGPNEPYQGLNLDSNLVPVRVTSNSDCPFGGFRSLSALSRFFTRPSIEKSAEPVGLVTRSDSGTRDTSKSCSALGPIELAIEKYIRMPMAC